MIDSILNNIDIDNPPPEVEDEGIVLKHKKQINIVGEPYGATPLEDKHGRSLWTQTRICYCDLSAETDCRFHNTKERGWEKCPGLELAQKNKNHKGRWLWARNPLYGKPPTEQELEQWSLQKVKDDELLQQEKDKNI